uniref:(northern house mosquito) hypothetical protein n=1 Tax=Culex pipiens TaxID=7175 RepID=A0A8D8FUC1_CULPI
MCQLSAILLFRKAEKNSKTDSSENTRISQQKQLNWVFCNQVSPKEKSKPRMVASATELVQESFSPASAMKVTNARNGMVESMPPEGHAAGGKSNRRLRRPMR